MKVNRTLYLAYYLKQLDKDKFDLFINYASRNSGLSRQLIIRDIIHSVFKYNISILEYFQFRFFELSHSERELWAGTGYMYEYQLKMNPKKQRHILDDKTLFYKNYGDFMIHKVADLKDLEENARLIDTVLKNPSAKLVFKVADGKCGAQVEVKDCEEFTPKNLLTFMRAQGYDLVEEFIVQHAKINGLSPSAVNTVRIITQLNQQDEVDILGCRFRISVDSAVDNMAAGNLAAPVDEKTGIVSGPGVYSDITKPDEVYHPITGVKIPGFQIPFWKSTIQLAKDAALLHPQNRSIGWDIVITDKGPGLIEGNHDWCKLLWQLPVKQGLKNILTHYLDGFPTETKKVKAMA